MLAFGFLLLCVALLSAAAGATGALWWQHHRARRVPARAMCDELTGLPNRQAVLETWARQLSLLERLKRPLTVLLIELDGASQWAERHGGEEAEQHMVQTLAQRMQPRLRTHDYLGRWDAHHFMALLPDTDVASALVLVEDLRQLVAGTPVSLTAHSVPCTVSVGVHGRVPQANGSWHDVAVEMAVAVQQALNLTQANGPNRIEIEP